MSRIKVEAPEKLIEKAQFYNVYNLEVHASTSIKQLSSTLINTVAYREVGFSYLLDRDVDMKVNVLDISKFKKDLGWESKICLEDETGLTLAWHQSRKRENAYVRL